MDRIPPFSAQKLEAACRILADTDRGLTGSEIGYLLRDCKLQDVTPEITKWKRLFNALAEAQDGALAAVQNLYETAPRR